MKVEVTAVGALTKYLEKSKVVKLNSPEVSLKDFAVEYLGIPATEPGVCFVVNGRVQNKTYILSDDDKITVLNMGGAG